MADGKTQGPHLHQLAPIIWKTHTHTGPKVKQTIPICTAKIKLGSALSHKVHQRPETQWWWQKQQLHTSARNKPALPQEIMPMSICNKQTNSSLGLYPSWRLMFTAQVSCEGFAMDVHKHHTKIFTYEMWQINKKTHVLYTPGLLQRRLYRFHIVHFWRFCDRRPGVQYA